MALDLHRRGWQVYATAIEVDDMVDLHKAGCEVRLNCAPLDSHWT